MQTLYINKLVNITTLSLSLEGSFTFYFLSYRSSGGGGSEANRKQIMEQICI